MNLTIYFDGSFWCGLVEYRDAHSNFRVLKKTFGKEPNLADIEQFIITELDYLLVINDSIPISKQIDYSKENKKSPKRVQREIKKSMKKSPVSTKAQLILQEQRDLHKVFSKKDKRKKKSLDTQTKFEQKQAKKRKKRRGH